MRSQKLDANKDPMPGSLGPETGGFFLGHGLKEGSRGILMGAGNRNRNMREQHNVFPNVPGTHFQGNLIPSLVQRKDLVLVKTPNQPTPPEFLCISWMVFCFQFVILPHS